MFRKKNPPQCRGHVLSLCRLFYLSGRVSQQLQRNELWHRFTALNLCRGKTSLPASVSYTASTPPLLLPSFVPFLFCLYRSHPLLSFHPATFIILSSLDHSSPPLSMPLFSLYLSLALTSLQHCSVGEDASTHFLSFVFPTCKVFNLNPTASSSHGRKTLFFIIIIITWHR